MATKPKTLRGFSVNYRSTDLSNQDNQLMKLMKDKLKNSTVSDRAYFENEDDANSDRIIMNDYDLQKSYCFGSIIKVREGKDTGVLPKTLLQEEMVSLSDIAELKEENLVIVYQYYFLIKENFIVTDFYSPSEVYPFEVYLNYILKDVRNGVYELVPYVEVNPEIAPGNIKRITVSNSFLQKQIGDSTVGISSTNVSLKDKMLQKIFGETGKLGEYNLADIVDAKLVLDFVKPKGVSEEDFQKQLGSSIKPFNNPDDFEAELKRGRGKIKGGELLKVKKVKVPVTDNGFIKEADYLLMMEKFIAEMK